jgi:hypothetical protein
MMNWLQDIENVVAPTTVAQANFELLETRVFRSSTPSMVAGVPNTAIGAPAAGTYVKYDRWVDVNGAVFECTVAGTPGTWRQIAPAMLAADPVAGTYATGYLIARTDVKNRERVCTAGGTPGTWGWAGRGLAAVADATGAGDVVAQFNALLARMRSAGEILP